MLRDVLVEKYHLLQAGLREAQMLWRIPKNWSKLWMAQGDGK
jgi:hypothetical protein